VEFEPMDDFEQEMRQALERRPAPPSLKQRVMDERARRMRQRMHLVPRMHSWVRIAASLLMVAILAGTAEWGIHRQQERRRGEEARRQLMIALRITGRELNQVQARLTTHDRGTGETR
jgi:hypothetical protein